MTVASDDLQWGHTLVVVAVVRASAVPMRMKLSTQNVDELVPWLAHVRESVALVGGRIYVTNEKGTRLAGVSTASGAVADGARRVAIGHTIRNTGVRITKGTTGGVTTRNTVDTIK